MPCERKPMRYGHSEGHTEVCFDDSGKFIVTCGNDGDVRIWESLDDDDPKFITVGEKAYSLALRNGKLVTASSNNTVQMHTFPDGDPDGILTRFTTNATHVTFNSSGSRVAAGSSDFMVKVVEVSDSSQQKTLRGHEAPVLSVAFDPKDDFLASASCDGSVVVWNIEEQTQVISWPLLQKTNDVSNAKSLCRLSWQPRTAKLLAVPVEAKVHLYERGSWEHVSSLSDDLLTQVSPGKHKLKPLSLLSQIVYTDTEGCLGLLDGLGGSTTGTGKQASVKKPAGDYDDLFDDDDNRLMDEGLSDTNSPVKKPVAPDDDDDDDFLMPATGRVRNRGAILDDENSLDTGSLRLGQDRFGDDDDAGSAVVPASAPLVPLRPVYEGPMPTPPQRAFQSGSTPAHLTHRFLMWNSVGIIRGYNDEQDNAIDVEFHDSAVHHAMHLTNSLGHTMADLSQEAVLLACPSTDELASKLQCLHFSSWDTNKEWMVDLPQGEDVKALCLGQGWAAVATDTLTLRMFSIGGVQREIFSLPGPVVCMSGHGEQLLIVYHRATGFDGEQALGVQLLQFGRRRRQLINGEALPLSHRSHLSWLGFTAEGTPCYVDSDGVVRMLNRSLANTWTPVCNTRDTCKSKSDHYWVVGVHENPQQLRTPVLKPLAPRAKTKTQSTLLQMTSSKALTKKTQENTEPAVERKQPDAPPPASPADNTESKRPKTGFQLWLEENRKNIVADNPELEETEIIKEAMGQFRTLSAEERLSWTERAKGQSGDAADLKKRKRAEGARDVENVNENAEADENSAKKKKSLDPSSKLSAFAFNKN
ncbi:WD repeat and HMG-box DNA-binding protein 1 [Stegastes partitus]|uniref:WD repeat and HMG-box DNA-binding protein 1 n=1 Tax=Stegastes partitus TaxID=144197 RepID=A0A9Y4NIT0_9TELE|nr:PREDICTED: WD repeat and HMG-box DNA-binding protein 1 [Stegastes partitus]